MDLKFGSGGESPKMDHIWNYDTARSCCLLIFVLTTNCNLKQYFFAKILKRVVNKKRTFNVRLLRSYFGPNHKNMRNFYPFFHWNLILWHSKHILSHCEGSQKYIFHALFVIVKKGAGLLQMEGSSSKRRNWWFQKLHENWLFLV